MHQLIQLSFEESVILRHLNNDIRTEECVEYSALKPGMPGIDIKTVYREVELMEQFL